MSDDDDDPIEWEFGVPASQVDLFRIRQGLLGIGVTEPMRLDYLRALERNAPVTHARYMMYDAEYPYVTVS